MSGIGDVKARVSAIDAMLTEIMGKLMISGQTPWWPYAKPEDRDFSALYRAVVQIAVDTDADHKGNLADLTDGIDEAARQARAVNDKFTELARQISSIRGHVDYLKKEVDALVSEDSGDE